MERAHDPGVPVEGDKHRRYRSRRVWWIAAGVVVAALAISGIVAASSPTPSSTTVVSPRAAPAFRLPDLRDPSRQLTLADFRGRPVVLNFWASWCVPCRREMPALQAVSRQVKGRIAFLGIDHQDDRSDALKFLRHTGVQYPVAFDPDGKTAAAYALFGIPTTIFINANGREVGRHLGELTEHDLESTLARLFPNR